MSIYKRLTFASRIFFQDALTTVLTVDCRSMIYLFFAQEITEKIYLLEKGASFTTSITKVRSRVVEPEPEPPFLAGAGAGAGAETNTHFRLRLRLEILCSHQGGDF